MCRSEVEAAEQTAGDGYSKSLKSVESPLCSPQHVAQARWFLMG